MRQFILKKYIYINYIYIHIYIYIYIYIYKQKRYGAIHTKLCFCFDAGNGKTKSCFLKV